MQNKNLIREYAVYQISVTKRWADLHQNKFCDLSKINAIIIAINIMD